ncbi:hypothetical protein LBMAG53_33510 [Planctomycetota bacterium]|nr:hypothetical protein LBMAG53_33510 [Planctomycetota bacterium]
MLDLNQPWILRVRRPGRAGNEIALDGHGCNRLGLGPGESVDVWLPNDFQPGPGGSPSQGSAELVRVGDGWMLQRIGSGPIPLLDGSRANVGNWEISVHRRNLIGTRLEVLTGPPDLPAGTVVPIPGPRASIGRDSDCAVRLDIAGISRRHAEIAHIEDRWRLNDTDSLNGTYLNGDPVRRPMWLAGGDRIVIGRTVVEFSDGRGTDLGLTTIDTTLGPARLQGLAGWGSFGGTWRARVSDGPHLGKLLAVKILDPGCAADFDEASLFLENARPLVDHPNLVKRYPPTTAGLPGPAAVQDWCAQGSLADLLAAGQPLPPDRCLDLAAAVAAGLGAAGRGHRGLRPSNILIHGGRFLVGDLDLCARFDPHHPEESPDPRWISPEEAEGAQANERANRFSLGLLLYHAATGRPPYVGQTRAELAAVRLQGSLPHPRTLVDDLPAGLEALIGHLLAREPRQRFADWAEVAATVQAIRAGKIPNPPSVGTSAIGSQPGSVRLIGTAGRSHSFLHGGRTVGLQPWVWAAVVILTVSAIAVVVARAAMSGPGNRSIPPPALAAEQAPQRLHLDWCRPGIWERGTVVLRDHRSLTGSFQIQGSSLSMQTGSIEVIPIEQIASVAFAPPAIASTGNELFARQRFAEAAEAFARALATPEGAGDPYLRSAAERARRSAEQVAAAAAAVPVAILAGDHRAVLDAVADYVAVAHPERLEPAWAAAVCTAWMHLAKADPKDLDRWHQAASAAGIDLGAPCPPGK